AHLRYRPIVPDDRCWMWSEVLGMWVGKWVGTYAEVVLPETFPRFFTAEGEGLPTRAEGAEQRADHPALLAEPEEQRADHAESELERLKKLVADLQRTQPNSPDEPH